MANRDAKSPLVLPADALSFPFPSTQQALRHPRRPLLMQKVCFNLSTKIGEACLSLGTEIMSWLTTLGFKWDTNFCLLGRCRVCLSLHSTMTPPVWSYEVILVRYLKLMPLAISCFSCVPLWCQNVPSMSDVSWGTIASFFFYKLQNSFIHNPLDFQI